LQTKHGSVHEKMNARIPDAFLAKTGIAAEKLLMRSDIA
jgi:hypothetical protein